MSLDEIRSRAEICERESSDGHSPHYGCIEWSVSDIRELLDIIDAPLKGGPYPDDPWQAAKWIDTLRDFAAHEEAYRKKLEHANSAMREVVEFAGYFATARGMHIQRWARRLKEVYREYRRTVPQETAMGNYLV